MNAPDRMDAVRVPAGMPKIQMTPIEKVPNAAVFKVAREDHTLGNLLRMELLKHPKVKFAGYKHPHPLDNDILVRIHTAAGTTPVQALRESAKRLEDDFRSLAADFDRQLRELAAEAERL